MIRQRLNLIGAGIALLLSTTGVNGQVPAPAAVDGVTVPAREGFAMHGTPRSAARADLFAGLDAVVTPPLDVAQLLAEDAQQEGVGPLRAGVVQPFREVTSATDGKWTQFDDGGWLWTMQFFAVGAKGVRLHLSAWNPPSGAELYVFSPEHPSAVRGPIRKAHEAVIDDFWTPTLYAQEIRLEYYLPGDLDHQAAAHQIAVDALLNEYRSLGGDDPEDGGALPCHLDVSCFSSWRTTAKAVGAIAFVNNQFGFFCSGSLLNRVGNDGTPLFMTADHCGVTWGNAPNTIVTWLWETDSCNGNLPNMNDLPQTLGLALLVRDVPHDFSIVGLDRLTGFGYTLAGWDANYWGDGSDAFGIHHPRGDFKRFSLGQKVDDDEICVNGTGGDVYEITWPIGLGLTEPGSSGSPIFDSAHRVRGTLTCGSSTCNDSNRSGYGRLDQAWGKAWPYLDPVNPVYANGAAGGGGDGRLSNPFGTVIEGVFAVKRGSSLYLTGSFPGSRRIDKAMTLRSYGGGATIGQ